MSGFKRKLSLLLACVMVFTVVSVGISVTASAAAPYVPRVAVNPPTPQVFTVPDAVRTQGGTIFDSGQTTVAYSSVQFRLDGATNINLNTNNSGVNFSAPSVNGGVYQWNINGAGTLVSGLTAVKFTVTFRYNGVDYAANSWVPVKTHANAPAIRLGITNSGGFLGAEDNRFHKATWIEGLYGWREGYPAPTPNAFDLISYNPNIFERVTCNNPSGIFFDGSFDSAWSGNVTYDVISKKGAASTPIGTYYVDRAAYSNLQDTPARIKTVSHMSTSSCDLKCYYSLQNITVNGTAFTTGFGFNGPGSASNNKFTLTTRADPRVVYSTAFTGDLTPYPESSTINARLRLESLAERSASGNTTVYEYFNLTFITYTKAALNSALAVDKAANRQAGDYYNVDLSGTYGSGFRTWAQYEAAYAKAWELSLREDTSQSAIDAAASTLAACRPVYDGAGNWVSGIMYAPSDYSAADFYLNNRVPASFTNRTYPDSEKGNLYTYTSATALNQAIEDLAYDRDLDKKYQVNVTTMTNNLIAAINGLTYKTFNIAFDANAGGDPNVQGMPAPAPYILYSHAATSPAITRPSNPTRKYYAFEGWHFNAAGTSEVNWLQLNMNPASAYFTGDLNVKDDAVRTGYTLYAKWRLTGVTISVNPNNGQAGWTLIGDPGEDVAVPAAPVNPGYDFVGWCTDPALNNVIDPSAYVFPAGNSSLYAKYAIANVTLEFDAGGGQFSNGFTYLEVVAPYMTPISEPEMPVRAGFGFMGWYHDVDCEIPVDFSTFTMPAVDTVLYTEWSTTIYTVTYELNDGSVAEYARFGFGDPVPLPTEPSKAGYTFGGWFLDSGFSGSAVSFPFNMAQQSITLYVKWNPNLYNVVFDLNDNSGTAEFPGFDPAVYEGLPCGAQLTAPLTEPTKEGFIFRGWSEEPDGEEYIFGMVPPGGTVLYGIWEADPPTIKFSIRTDAESDVLQIGDVITVTVSVEANFIVGLHSFLLYYDNRYFEPALNGNSYNTPISVGGVSATPGAAYFTLIDNDISAKPEGYNVWENGLQNARLNNRTPILPYYPAEWRNGNSLLSQYNHFDYVYYTSSVSTMSPNGGFSVMPSIPQDLCSFQLKVKDLASATTTGEFAQLLMPEYFTSNDTNGKIGASVQSQNEYNYVGPTTGIVYEFENNDLRFEIEEAQNCELNFVTDGGDAISPISYRQGRIVTLPTPNKQYNEFLYWTVGSPSGPTADLNEYEVPAQESIILYAHWNPVAVPYYVTHFLEDVSVNPSSPTYSKYGETEEFSALIGPADVHLTSLTIPGFECISSVDVNITEPELEFELYYRRKTVTISFNTDGGTPGSIAPISGKYGYSIPSGSIPANPQKTGYTFGGWFDGSTAFNFTAYPVDSVTLKAAWSANTYTFRFFIDDVLQEELTQELLYATGTLLNEPDYMPPSGLIFSGWKYNNTLYSFGGQMPAQSMDFYATLAESGFYVNRYIVTVGPAQLLDTIFVPDGTQLTASMIAYVPPVGQTVTPWRTGSATNAPLLSLPMTLIEDIDIYTTQGPFRGTITFTYVDEFGEEWSDQIRQNVQYGASIVNSSFTFYLNMPIVAGFDFDGWYTDADREGELFDFTDSPTMPDYNLVFYGAYVKQTVYGTVEFDLNGGTGTIPTSITEPVDTDIFSQLPDDGGGTNFEKAGCLFVGWSEDKNALPANVIETSYEIQEGTKTLYAIWAPLGVKLIPMANSTTVIDYDKKFIYGLKLVVTESDLRNIFLDVEGSGYFTVQPGTLGTGAIVTLYSNYDPNFSEEYRLVIFGDVTGDGLVTASDVSEIKRFIADNESVPNLDNRSSPFFFAADLYQNGVVNQSVASIVNQIALGARGIDQQTGLLI